MLDELRERLDCAREQTENRATMNHVEGQERLPDDALGLDEIRAMCAAARERGHQAGLQRGRAKGETMGQLRSIAARRDGETAGALAAVRGMLNLLAVKHPERADRTRGADARRELLAELTGQLRATAEVLETEGVHGEHRVNAGLVERIA